MFAQSRLSSYVLREMTKPPLKSYNRKIGLLGNQLCRHLEAGGDIHDTVGSIVIDKIIAVMRKHRDLWSECRENGIDDDIIRRYIQRSVTDLGDEIVVSAPMQPILIGVYMLCDTFLRVNFLLGIRHDPGAADAAKREKTIQSLLESAQLFRINNQEWPYRALKIEDRGGLPESAAKGCGCSPAVVILTITVLVLAYLLWW